MRITHLVCTPNFAGVERHVAVLAAAQHDLGHEVTVLGGDTEQMRRVIDRPDVRVVPVRSVGHALRLLAGDVAGSADVVATHMTASDLAAAASPRLRHTPIVSTRHFVGERGSTPHARAGVSALIHRVTTDIAVSRTIADAISGDTTVVHPGVPERPLSPGAAARDLSVLLVQRLEPEKATDVAIRAFAASGLAGQGWRLRIAGDGSERPALEALVRDLGIDAATDFLGRHPDVPSLMARAGMLLAPCPVEGLGLSVLEAMASGLPVVASAAGGHLETVGPTPDAALFPVDDAPAAAAHLSALACDPDRRDRYGTALRERQRTEFTVVTQAEATDEVYRHALALKRSGPTRAFDHDLVIISLEPWDEVWRRNQHLVAGLLRSDPGLRVLFVEPAVDPVHAVRRGTAPRRARGLRRGPHLRGVDPDALWLHEPLKALPRTVDPGQDERWAKGVHRAADQLGMEWPLLWVNDPNGAEVLTATGWPALYDITDDWLEADRDALTLARLTRQERVLMDRAAEVVVCSPGLQRTKSRRRPVTLLRNAVDAETTRAAARPADLPPGATTVYVGTLHADRLDVGLCVETASALGDTATLVLVGPDALTPAEGRRLDEAGVIRLGAKDRREIPGYLQHADVLLVPHVVDDFTESLDPIKLYEYRAVGRQVVSTPVSGFREAAGPRVHVVEPVDFPAAVLDLVPATDRFPVGVEPGVATWADRVGEMREVIDRVAASGGGPLHDRSVVPLAARVRLGHAAVQYVADRDSVDLLHVKGHALHPSLVHAGRGATDVDVLVRPDQVHRLLRALEMEGFVRKGRFATSSPFEHSVTLSHDLWGHIDVHRLFPGIGLAPDRAFERLWGRRGEMTIAGRPCPVPDVHAQALLLVLHAARNVPGGQTSLDVEHVWGRAGTAARGEIETVVDELDARVAFAIGTGDGDALPPSPERDLWRAMSTPGGRVHEWRARITAAPSLAGRLRLILRAPLVNTDHLATQLGHRPSRREVATEFIDRARRAAGELRSQR